MYTHSGEKKRNIVVVKKGIHSGEKINKHSGEKKEI